MAFRGISCVFVLAATCGASAEMTPTSQQAGAPAGVCLLQKSPGELKSGLDRLEPVLSNVHRLLDRHKELSDRLHQGGRHIGKAAREAHSTVGKALTLLRQSSESLIDVAGAGGSHAALHAALLQLSKPASDLKSGLDRLEASADDAEADEKKDEEGQQTNEDLAPTNSNKELAASEKDEGEEGKEKQQEKEEKEEEQEKDEEGEHDAIDEKSKKKLAASQHAQGQGVEQDQLADKKSSKQFAAISRHKEDEEKEEEAEEEGEDAAEEKSKKELAASSQKREGVRDGEDGEAHDKSQNKEASASQEEDEDDGKEDQKDQEDGQKEGSDVQQEGEAGEDEEKSKKKIATASTKKESEKDEVDGEAGDKNQNDEAPALQEDGEEEQKDREDQQEGKEDEEEGDVKSERKLAASQEDDEEEEGREGSPSPALSKKSLAALELNEEEGEDADEEAYEANTRKLAAIERDIDSLGASVAALIELNEDSEDAPEVSQDPMANGFPKKVAPKHDVDHDAMNMKATKMSIKGLPEESSYENHLTQTADWRNEYKWSTEAPSPALAQSDAARALPLAAALAASLAFGLL